MDASEGDNMAQQIEALLEPVQVIEFEATSRYLIAVRVSLHLSGRDLEYLTSRLKSSLEKILDGVHYQVVVLMDGTSLEFYQIKHPQE